MALPVDYLERVYAGVLGKIIGVYLGRPFEGWTHQEIIEKLGHIKYYVNDRLNVPLIVVDDDITGTFLFPRALHEHGVSKNITSEAIGKTWLNNVIENSTVFWWGGNGISTEHTAFLNLKKGIQAPASGSIETNGKTVAEQIGAQIFIDGWAMLAPGDPALAARLAEAAAKVSHDGESVYAAMMLAAMEAEAFLSKDVNHLLDTGVHFIPKESQVAKMISDVRQWAKEDKDWLRTRQRIEDEYGYDKFSGNCHVMPNHGIMILALLYGGHSFHEAMHIINTCGWDTDCNSGNIGCLVALMHGMQAFEGGPDWRGPIADRVYISSADASYSINNAALVAYDIANLGRQLAGETALVPKDGAQYHFSLPGSVQGFQPAPEKAHRLRLQQVADGGGGRSALAIRLIYLTRDDGAVEVMTPTFTSPELVKDKTYDLAASPLLYPGQTVSALLRASSMNTGLVDVKLLVRVYSREDRLLPRASPKEITLAPGMEEIIEWRIPDTFDCQPIQAIGITLAIPLISVTGIVWLDYLRIDGTPQLKLQHPFNGPCDFWKRAWINNVSTFHTNMGPSFYLAQNSGVGTLTYGTREWKDYKVTVSKFRVNLGRCSGLAIRVQGLRRYYAFLFMYSGRVGFVRVLDDTQEELKSAVFDWRLDQEYEITVNANGSVLRAQIDGKDILEAVDNRYQDGGIGFVVASGSISAESVEIGVPE